VGNAAAYIHASIYCMHQIILEYKCLLSDVLGSNDCQTEINVHIILELFILKVFKNIKIEIFEKVKFFLKQPIFILTLNY
jgi:hypothetical protein